MNWAPGCVLCCVWYHAYIMNTVRSTLVLTSLLRNTHPFNCSMVKSLINYHFIDKNSTFSLVWSYYLLLENNNCVRNSLPMNPSCHVIELFLIVKGSRKFNALYVRVDEVKLRLIIILSIFNAIWHIDFKYLRFFVSILFAKLYTL